MFWAGYYTGILDIQRFLLFSIGFPGKALNLSVSKLSSYEMRIIDASCLPLFIQFIYLDGKLLVSDHVFMHGLEQ